MLSNVDRRATIFAAKREALYEPQRDQHHRRHDAPSGEAGKYADEERADAHQRHRNQERVFAADQIAEMAEDQSPERANREPGGEREQREMEPTFAGTLEKKYFARNAPSVP